MDLKNMTQKIWDGLTISEKDRLRSLSQLTPQFIGLEGWRVEVLTTYGEKRRFIIGRSTGWIPCHLEVNNRRSMGGCGAEKEYTLVTKLYKVR